MNEASNRLLYASGGPAHLGKINQEWCGQRNIKSKSRIKYNGQTNNKL